MLKKRINMYYNIIIFLSIYIYTGRPRLYNRGQTECELKNEMMQITYIFCTILENEKTRCDLD